jgi:two-component system NarL family sensor kinase
MPIQNNEIFFAVIIVCVVFVLLVLLVSVLIFLHRNKVKRMDIEKQILQTQFQETLLRSQLEMQEQTFNTISQEIHDNVGQILSLVKVQLNIIDQQETLSKTAITEVKDNISKAMTDLRDIAKSLSSDRIQLIDFKEAMESELNRINRTNIIHASMEVEGRIQNFPQQKKLILFRIIQEALQNIIKHAQANTVAIFFKYTEEKVVVSIRDNGKGFTVNDTSMDGLGLQNIINRTKLIGGNAIIQSIIEEGTTIILTIPYA